MTTVKAAAELVVIGASLGGLDATSKLLAALPESFAVPIALAQHRRADPESRLEAVLAKLCCRRVCEPNHGDAIAPHTVYLAPADYHLLVERGTFALSVDEPHCFSRPSIDVLFESAADAYGSTLVAVLLTGASNDGARGLRAIQRAGGVTIVQDPDDAESPIAPRAALACMTPDHVVPLPDISVLLRSRCGGTVS